MRSRLRSVTATLLLPALLAVPAAAAAAVPGSLTEQGRLFDPAGAPLGGTVSITFAIYAGPTGGVALWSETQAITLDAGYFSAQLGAGVSFPAGLWDGSARYLGIQVGADPEMTPRQATQSVPYALVAGDAIGDLHPHTVTVHGTMVIDANGNWVGPPTGLVGPAGATGPAGANGATGPAGANGATGPAGANGATGPAGANGATGPAGANGATGPAGAAGTNGAVGATGPAGAAGPTGPQGVAGSNGTNGAVGATGPQGPTGTPGAAGAAGAQGPAGPQGPQGTIGATGPQGPVGPTGPNAYVGAAAPSSPTTGALFYDTVNKVLEVWDGTAWQSTGSGSGGGGSSWPLGSAGNPAASCSALKAANPAAATSAYYLSGSPGAFQTWCEMDTDGGGWTLVMAATDATRWAGSKVIWNDTTYDAGLTVTPSAPGKSLAYSQITGDQILFKTHSEVAGRWAEFDMPASSTVLGLVGTTPLLSYSAGYQKTLVGRALGSAAHPCWGGDWRVNYRSYTSADASPDSSIFAPAEVSVGRPCGGNASWGSGLGVITDSSGAYSGTFEGYGPESGGNSAVTGGYVAIYVRTRPTLPTPPLGSAGNAASSCKAILQAGAATGSGVYYLTGGVVGRFPAYCDFGTDIDATGGGWTLVMSTNSASTWSGLGTTWFTQTTDFPSASNAVLPTAFGKSPAYYQTAGTEIVFRTHAEATGRWARYTLPGSTTLAGMLGTTSLLSQAVGYKATLTKVAVGAAAVPCFNQDWRVNWYRYPSSDSSPDSAIFAPSTLTSSFRPCGGSTAYATGFGVATDSSGSYGSSFEGYAGDNGGNTAVSGGYLSIYVR
jgi:hypothetical protein